MNELIRLARRVGTPFDQPFEANAELEQAVRIAEALIFAARSPISRNEVAQKLPPETEVDAVLAELRSLYLRRGVNLVQRAGGYTFRTATDLAYLLATEESAPRRLSRAALETLAIVAYHQPVTRAEIEDIRGVAVAKGTLDTLLEAGFMRMRGRRKTPGRPITYGTTPGFLDHFGLDKLSDLPGLDELKGAGLIEGRVAKGFSIPSPRDEDALGQDEDPLEDGAAGEALLAAELGATDGEAAEVEAGGAEAGEVAIDVMEAVATGPLAAKGDQASED